MYSPDWLKLNIQPRIALNSPSSSLQLLSTVITDMPHNVLNYLVDFLLNMRINIDKTENTSGSRLVLDEPINLFQKVLIL